MVCWRNAIVGSTLTRKNKNKWMEGKPRRSLIPWGKRGALQKRNFRISVFPRWREKATDSHVLAGVAFVKI